jgi:hypothetical protein
MNLDLLLVSRRFKPSEAAGDGPTEVSTCSGLSSQRVQERYAEKVKIITGAERGVQIGKSVGTPMLEAA